MALHILWSSWRSSGHFKCCAIFVDFEWAPQTKPLHFEHRFDTFCSLFLGHMWHRPLFLPTEVFGATAGDAIPRSDIAVAMCGRRQIYSFKDLRWMAGSVSDSPTSIRNKRRLSRRLEPEKFFHSGCHSKHNICIDSGSVDHEIKQSHRPSVRLSSARISAD